MTNQRTRAERGLAEMMRRAENGDREAAWTLGDAYADGGWVALPDGTRTEVRRHRGRAIRWLRRAAELGELDALARWGVLLTDSGRPEDVAEGIALLKRAWRQGCRVAAQNLAVTYSEQGNRRRCAAWLRKACRHEESADWLLMGIARAAGYGMRKDLAEAVRLFRKVRDDESGFPCQREDAAGFLGMLARKRVIRVAGSIGRVRPEEGSPGTDGTHETSGTAGDGRR